MVSGLAEGALVSPLMISTSADFSLTLSMGHGCVVNVDEDEMYATCSVNSIWNSVTVTLSAWDDRIIRQYACEL